MSRTPRRPAAASAAARNRELSPLAGLPTDDSLCRWAAQRPGAARVFSRGDAVAVASPDLSLHDRLAVAGPPHDALPLVRDVLAEVGATYRLIGDRQLVDALLPGLPALRPVPGFGWMERSGAPAGPAEAPGPDDVPRPHDDSACWLPASAGPEIGALLDAAFPRSYAYPGRPGARDRWAGVRLDGRLAAVAALIWCAADVGYIAGVATSPAARGRGLARRAGAFVVAEALASYGTAALIVDDSNPTARRLYESVGLAYRPLRGAAVGA